MDSNGRGLAQGPEYIDSTTSQASRKPLSHDSAARTRPARAPVGQSNASRAPVAHPADGKRQRIDGSRAVVLDIIRMARKVPSFPVERWCNVADVREARENTPKRISWLTVFGKAYCLACRDVPELRRTYVGFPWPGYYQSPHCVLSIAVTRLIDGQERLFFGRLHQPESKSLLQIQAELESMQNDEVARVFRQQVIGASLPSPIRRIGWWWRKLRLSKRAKCLGTCSMSVLAGQGVYNRLHPNVLTSSLSYGPIEDGRMWLTLQCDHRVIDGVPAARGLNAICEHLNTTVLRELQSMQSGSKRDSETPKDLPRPASTKLRPRKSKPRDAA